MTPHIKLQHTVLVMALAAIYPLQASAAPSAGVAQFIVGDVNVRRADGGSTPLVKGKDIESGQAIVTGPSGRAQVRFTDGGLVSPAAQHRVQGRQLCRQGRSQGRPLPGRPAERQHAGHLPA